MLGYLSLDILCSSKLTVHLSKQIMFSDRRTINTRASIWWENMLGYLSLDIIQFLKLTVHLSEQIMFADIYPFEHIFASIKWRLHHLSEDYFSLA